MIEKLKAAFARLGADKSDPAPEAIWSKQWCAKEPELAAKAIATLQDRVEFLEVKAELLQDAVDYANAKIDKIGRASCRERVLR